jgi:hypothetical protein
MWIRTGAQRAPTQRPRGGMPLEYNVNSAISRYREKTAHFLPEEQKRAFENPSPGNSVRACEFLSHLDLNAPAIRSALLEVYPYLETVPGLREEVHARVRFVAWMALSGFNQLAPALRRLRLDVDAQRSLGFRRGIPCYDTFRELLHERLTGATHERLLDALLTEQLRLCHPLGREQVQDATPMEARRREQEAPYNPHYGTRMMKLELRWDPTREALLTQQFYNGLQNEGQWLAALTERTSSAGATRSIITVDGGYTSFQNIAHTWRQGHNITYKRQEHWKIDSQTARQDVLKRYQTHWQHPKFIQDASLNAKLRFLIDYGSPNDLEAAGRHLRDQYISEATCEEIARVGSRRNQNEGLNAELKRLPTQPARRGVRELLRRAQACTLTLHLVQLTRLQNGVKTSLCRVAHIL